MELAGAWLGELAAAAEVGVVREEEEVVVEAVGPEGVEEAAGAAQAAVLV